MNKILKSAAVVTRCRRPHRVGPERSTASSAAARRSAVPPPARQSGATLDVALTAFGLGLVPLDQPPGRGR